MSRKLIAPFALALAAVGASPSYADTLQTGGFANGFENITATLTTPNLPTEPGQAGGFVASFNDGPSFTAYCIDLFQNIALNTSYTDFTSVDGGAYAFTNANANTDLGKLFSEGVSVNSSVAQAAFQLAVWEITYETSGSYGVGSGNATFTAASNVVDLANTWLSALADTTDAYTITVYQSPTAQDLIQATPAVPEPSTYALLAAGLLTVAFVARRRPSKN